LPVDHYENFPVASWLLPARYRPPIEAIYGFARGADDFADEGEMSDEARLAGLARYSRALNEIEARGSSTEPGFDRIAWAIREYKLPLVLLRDLIDAFSQDVTTKRYATFADLMDYSRRSANPIGRLLLHLFGNPMVEQSDAICSALQFINFWQDVAVDWEKGRVYIPQEDLRTFGVSERQIQEKNADERWTKLMQFESQRAREMLRSGAPLGRALPGRLGLEIRATVQGGMTILDRIDAVGGDVFRHRPVLKTLDWIRILARAL
jgi:squalene synthase HpnC